MARVAEALAERPRVAAQFGNCFPNTLDTTTQLHEDGTTYVFTGDIPAMWLRDSSAQVSPYVPLAAQDDEVRRIITGVIRKQVGYILIDPYANAFNRQDVENWLRRTKSNFRTEMPLFYGNIKLTDRGMFAESEASDVAGAAILEGDRGHVGLRRRFSPCGARHP